jgi:sec-independent protein translocase protein TatC
MWILFEFGILFGRLAKRDVADPERDEPAGE